MHDTHDVSQRAPILPIVAAVVAALAGAVALRSAHGAKKSYDVPATPVPVSRDSATVERGRHLVTAVSNCVACHGDDLGGRVMVSKLGVGRVVASNLTAGRGGVLGRYDDAQLARAIRAGVGPDGRSLRVMPARDFAPLSDADVGAMIAYLRAAPPVDRTLPSTKVGPGIATLYAIGRFPLYSAEGVDHRRRAAAAVAADTTVGYGRYLAQVGGCAGCHGATFAGGAIPGAPPGWKHASDLTPSGAMARWREADFVRALREGRRPDGTPIDSLMPWKSAGRMSDAELAALWSYFRSLPPATGGQ